MLKVWSSFSLLLIVKCERTEKYKLKEFLSKKELDLEDLENSQPIYISKNEEAGSGENSRGWLEIHFT